MQVLVQSLTVASRRNNNKKITKPVPWEKKKKRERKKERKKEINNFKNLFSPAPFYDQGIVL